MKIAIIGAGITGLTAAYYLAEQGKDFFVVESKEQIGGLAKSFKGPKWDWPLEEYFHHYFTSDREVKKIAERLGVKDKLFYQKVRTSIYSQGTIYPFDRPGDLLNFPNLNLVNKLRMGGIIFALRFLPYLPFYCRLQANQFFPELIGQQGWEKIWQPLMEGKFKGLVDQVSFSWLWARIKKRSTRLGYFQGGTKILIDSLKERIKKRGKIFTKTKIEKIKRTETDWQLISAGRQLSADKVILALPLPAAIKLIQPWKGIDSQELSQWRQLKNIGALALILRLNKKFLPGESYWLNILDKNFPFIVIVEQTNLIDSKHYNNEHIVYVGGYHQAENKIFTRSKKKIFQSFAPYLRRLNPSLDNFLKGYELFSYQLAQPVIPTNYPQIKPKLSLIPGQLYWATSNHVFPWDRGLNYSIKLGKQVADKISA